MLARKKPLISADEALHAVAEAATPSPEELVPLMAAVGRVLRRPVFADRDFPPFHRVTMDGIAIAYASFAAGNRHFPIEHTAMAGAAPPPLGNPNGCIEIMTGAPLPAHTDTVIRYEDLELSEQSIAFIKPDAVVEPFQNVHRQGSDAASGLQLMAQGIVLGAPQIAVAAACGYAELYTSRVPSVAIVGTGDELVAVEATPLPHQIRQSNAYMLAAALRGYGIQANTLHLPDSSGLMATEMARLTAAYDLIIMSGGVSAGKADYVPDILTDTGVEIIFHGVQQKPGKPLLFGKASTGAIVFALPGNPVSAFMCLQRYVMAWLRKYLQQQEPATMYARLAADITFRAPLTYFLQVQTFCDSEGILWAEPIAGGGSGDFINLLSVNGFLILPPHQSHFSKGEIFPLMAF